MRPAARLWAEQLGAWAIPDRILAAAPESPYRLDPAAFAAPAEAVDTPSRRRAAAALPDSGTVLDVGCGAGAAGLALVPPAGHVTGVDSAEGMLDAFVAAARQRGVAHRAVTGRWPDVAGEAGRADVVVCHHVLYNVAEVPGFAAALTASARRRVVVEITAEHPWSTLAPLWEHFHGYRLPAGPTAALARRVIGDTGVEVTLEEWIGPPRPVERGALVAALRRRLCLTAEADAAIERLIGEDYQLRPRRLATLWWEGAG